MAYLGKTFTAAEMPQQDSFEALPAGDYVVQIESVELKNTNNGAGEYLQCKLRVHGPTHQNRVVFDRIIISHSNPQAEEIGLKRFNSLLRAIGLPSAHDTEQLIGHSVKAQLKVGTPSEKYPEPGNDVVTYKALDGKPLPAPAQTEPAPVAEKKPWER